MKKVALFLPVNKLLLLGENFANCRKFYSRRDFANFGKILFSRISENFIFAEFNFVNFGKYLFSWGFNFANFGKIYFCGDLISNFGKILFLRGFNFAIWEKFIFAGYNFTIFENFIFAGLNFANFSPLFLAGKFSPNKVVHTLTPLMQTLCLIKPCN